MSILICAACLGACKSNNGSRGNGGAAGGSGSETAKVDSCNDQCDAQELVQGCTPFVDLATCKSLCSQLVAGLPSTCGSQPACVGANAHGTCPQVQCPCPTGVVPVSGFDSTASGCTCWDTTTCKDLTCS